MPIGPNEIFTGLVLLALGGSVVGRLAKGKSLGIFGAGRSVEAAQDAGDTLTAPEGGEIPAGAWIRYVSDNPHAAPHLLVAGGSGTGKTTIATELLAARQGRVCIITAKEGDPWGGLPYTGIDDDGRYQAANAVFQALGAEVRARLVAVKQKRLTADWLTVVLDDYSTLRLECDQADAPFKLIARLGRSLRVRLIVLSDSDLVKPLGLEGEGETRGNFILLRLRRGRVGTIQVERTDPPMPIAIPDLRSLPKLDAARAWRPPLSDEAELAMRLGVGTSSGGADLAAGNWYREPVPGGSGVVPPRQDAVPAGSRARAIKALLDGGMSGNEIADALGGRRADVLAEVRALRGENN